MRWSRALVFSSIICPSIASVYLGLDVCPWTPLQGPALISLAANASVDGANRTPVHAGRLNVFPDSLTSDDDTWSGPHACAGKYCVFSGRGLSIVTTDRSGELISAMKSDTGDTRRQSLPFRTTQIPGKGIGMVATRKIKRGELVLAAVPAMIIHRDFIKEVSHSDQHRLLDVAVNRLPEYRKQLFLAQATDLGGYKIEDIMLTNSFQVILDDDNSQHLGNFPEVSRYNHDCRPNVAFYIDKDLVHRTHAVRDIELGEELTISYLDSFSARSVRQARAKASWGFHCTCSQCSLPELEAHASDARLVAIYEVENQLADFNNDYTTPAMVERLISLYMEERLTVKMADAYTLAAVNFNQFGMAEMAKKYAELSIEQGLIEYGPGAPDIKAMQRLIRDPTRHWSWNRRPWHEKGLP